MSSDYKISLVARNEGLLYRDSTGIYRFDVELSQKVWKVYLPGSKGENYEPHELSADETKIVLPRIEGFLATLKYFRLFGPTYPVRFETRVSNRSL
jgi:hypothetical protein